MILNDGGQTLMGRRLPAILPPLLPSILGSGADEPAPLRLGNVRVYEGGPFGERLPGLEKRMAGPMRFVRAGAPTMLDSLSSSVAKTKSVS